MDFTSPSRKIGSSKRNGNESLLDTISAIWILASNDENPEISYIGLRHRLHLAEWIDERQLVAQRGELFRLKIPKTRLTEIKTRYRIGSHLPIWLREIPEGQKREETIENLTEDDFFRSQFRAEPNAPRSPIEIMNWGLQHIDRLRKTAIGVRETKMKRWSSIWIPLLSTCITLVAVSGSLYVQRQASADQRALKEYEVSFRPKVDGYTRFLQALSTSFERAANPQKAGLSESFNDADLIVIQLEPFLKSNIRDRFRNDFMLFENFCFETKPRDQLTKMQADSVIDVFIKYRNGFHTTLYSALFQ